MARRRQRLRRVAAREFNKRRRRHRRTRARLSLAAADLRGKARTRRHEHADQPAREHRAQHRFFVACERLRSCETCARESPARARRRRRHEHTHRTLHFHQRRHIQNRAVEQAAVEELLLLEHRREAMTLPRQDAIRVLGAREADAHAAAHDLKDSAHLREDLVGRDCAARALVLEREVGEFVR